MLHANLSAGKNLGFCRLNIGSAQKQFERRLPAHAFKVDGIYQQVLEWIVIERIRLIGRNKISHWHQEPKTERLFEAEI